ncbi:hypothetical protein ACC723_37630, partial [Rhizobium ruizarguesonis]
QFDRGPSQPVGYGRKRGFKWDRQVADPDADANGDSDESERGEEQCEDGSQLPEAKINFLNTDPAVSQIPAVKNKTIVIMDGQAMNPTVRTV